MCEVLSIAQAKLVRHVATVLCRENSHMIRSALLTCAPLGAMSSRRCTSSHVARCARGRSTRARLFLPQSVPHPSSLKLALS